MGYDMQMIGPATDTEEAAKAVAHELFRDACKERDQYKRGTPEYEAAQTEVDQAFTEWNDLPDGYFRLNIWAMGHCRDFMLERDMAYEARGLDFPKFEWPKREAFEDDDQFRAAEEEAEAQYMALIEPVIEHHPEGGDGIPTFKLGSNDGWHVTEAECAAAVAAARADGSIPTILEDGEHVIVQWWETWIDYLDRASQRGGFRVH